MQMESVRPALPHFTEGTSRNVVILSTVTDTIPTVTERVLNGNRPYLKSTFITQALETRGGYKLV